MAVRSGKSSGTCASGGASWRIAWSVSTVCSRANARRPVSISKQDRAQREQVRPAVDRRRPGSAPAPGIRRSRARPRSGSKARRARRVVRELGDPEIQDLRRARSASGRCSRASGRGAPAGRVRRDEARGHVRAESAGLLHGQRAAPEARPSGSRRRAAPPRDTAGRRARSDVVEPDDVRVVERGGHARFLHEALDPLRASGAVGARTFSATSRRSRTSVAR